MAHPYHHAMSSVKHFGGVPADYSRVHDWFDATKAHLADFRHRALRHHAEGIFWCEEEFGQTLTNSDGKQVPVRLVAERHVREDLGRIPTVADWLRGIPAQAWMHRDAEKLSRRDDGPTAATPPAPVREAGEEPNRAVLIGR